MPLWFVLHIKLWQFSGNTKVTSLQPRQEQGLSLRVSGCTASLLAHSIISGGKNNARSWQKNSPSHTHTLRLLEKSCPARRWERAGIKSSLFCISFSYSKTFCSCSEISITTPSKHRPKSDANTGCRVKSEWYAILYHCSFYRFCQFLKNGGG